MIAYGMRLFYETKRRFVFYIGCDRFHELFYFLLFTGSISIECVRFRIKVLFFFFFFKYQSFV